MLPSALKVSALRAQGPLQSVVLTNAPSVAPSLVTHSAWPQPPFPIWFPFPTPASTPPPPRRFLDLLISLKVNFLIKHLLCGREHTPLPLPLGGNPAHSFLALITTCNYSFVVYQFCMSPHICLPQLYGRRNHVCLGCPCRPRKEWGRCGCHHTFKDNLRTRKECWGHYIIIRENCLQKCILFKQGDSKFLNIYIYICTKYYKETYQGINKDGMITLGFFLVWEIWWRKSNIRYAKSRQP